MPRIARKSLTLLSLLSLPVALVVASGGTASAGMATTTGTVNPGVIYIGSTFQVGLEAMIPVNRASGTGVGVLGQLHLYLDDMFPSTIGQPLFGGTSAPPRKMTF